MRIIELLRKAIVQNIFALYGVYFFNYLIPLVTVPYLTRVLGAEGWGRYAFYQSIAFYGVMIVEYSFVTYGVREVARHRNDVQFRGEILTAVYGAKFLLAAGVLLVAAVAYAVFPTLRQFGLTYGFAILWGLTLGFSLIWYFQGLERMKLVASLDIATKVLATVSVFFYVHERGEEWKVFVVYGIANILSLLMALAICVRDTPLRWSGVSKSLAVLKDGWTLFFARVNVAVFTTSNVFLLGLFVSTKEIGFYAGAEKICRAFGALSGPISQAVYPRLSQTVQHDFAGAFKLARRSFWLLFLMGAAFFVLIFVAAPIFALRFLGPEFESSILLLRILAIYPLFLAMNSVLSSQWMLSLGLDKWINRLAIGAAVLDISLVLLLVPTYGAKGMAITTVLIESLSTCALSAVLIWRRQHPLFPERAVRNS
jgi:polysaccharide transporter, PST family